jgi:hypothetical protein
LLVSKGSTTARDSHLKLVWHFVNLMALLMVLLLGAVSVHADEAGHAHGNLVHASVADTDSHADIAQQGHGDAAIHCGAPILGPEPMTLGYSVRVAPMAYFDQDTAMPLELAVQDLRPPRL